MDIGEFIDALPAGEWADLVPVAPDGMMATRNWAYLLRGRWLKAGGQRVFVKYLLEASDGAGRDTDLLTSAQRLQRVNERLVRIAALANRVPLVRLLEVRISSKPIRGLLVAMEEIVPLHDLIMSGRATRETAISILLRLSSPTSDGLSFHHFDVCPRNIGLRANGDPVYIDPESFFLVEPDGVGVTTPAWKRPRAPLELVRRVDAAFAAEGVCLPSDIAEEKLNYELATVAAECCIGPMPFSGQRTFGPSVLNEWMRSEQAHRNPGLARYWFELFLGLLQSPLNLDLGRIANELAVVDAGGAGPILHPQAPPDAAPTVAGSPRPDADWQKAWARLQPTGARLRGGLLSPKDVAEYLGELESLRARFPSTRELWLEMLLVCISFLKSRQEATRVAQLAVAALPSDDEILQLARVVNLWGKDRFDGTR